MAADESPNIKSIRAGQDRQLIIVWENGAESVIDVGEFIRTYKVFRPIRDNDEEFRKVSRDEWGWCAHWSNDMEISSETLWDLAVAQGGMTVSIEEFAQDCTREERANVAVRTAEPIEEIQKRDDADARHSQYPKLENLKPP
jgi:hypothetical protein